VFEECCALTKNPRPTPGFDEKDSMLGAKQEHAIFNMELYGCAAAAEPMSIDYKATTLGRQSVSGHVCYARLIEIRTMLRKRDRSKMVRRYFGVKKPASRRAKFLFRIGCGGRI
jgi:hypothetical protein